MKSRVTRFLSDENGLELVEYAVMTALIVGALITAIAVLSESISSRFEDVQDVIEDIDE